MSQPAAPADDSPLAEARWLLQQLLPTDNDFDAFVIDRFRYVFQHFGAGMTRLAKTNALLLYIDSAEVLQALRATNPVLFDRRRDQRIAGTEPAAQPALAAPGAPLPRTEVAQATPPPPPVLPSAPLSSGPAAGTDSTPASPFRAALMARASTLLRLGLRWILRLLIVALFVGGVSALVYYGPIGYFEYQRSLCADDNLGLTAWRTACQSVCQHDAEQCQDLADRYSSKDRSRAIALYEQSCERGHLPACTSAAQLHAHEPGIVSGLKGLLLFYRSCDGGVAEACRQAAAQLEAGPLVKPDLVEARKLYRRGCDAGSRASCTAQGRMAYGGSGGEKNLDAAIALFQTACEGQDPDGCYWLARCYEQGHGTVPDFERAVHFYEKACDDNQLASCAELGVIYEKGRGSLKKDVLTAVNRYQKACDGNLFLSCRNIGRLLSQNDSYRDLERARTAYQRACGGNDPPSCTELALIYANGNGTSKDPQQTKLLYEKACNGGELGACNNLGAIFYNDKGSYNNPKQAKELFEKACNGELPVGCNNLALTYESGQGVTPDPKQAAALYRKACSGGHKDACTSLARLEPPKPAP